MRAHRAVLFDVDGVLLDTGGLFRRVWYGWATDRLLDPDWVVARTYGRRSVDVVREVAPHLDAAAELRALDELTLARLGEVRAAAGAGRLLRALHRTPWAIVTSGSRWFMGHAFTATALPQPSVAVYGEDVRAGKPAPECYLLAACRLGLAPRECVVVEDAPDGIAAAKDAGCSVIAVASTHDPGQLSAADACLPSLSALDSLLWTFMPMEEHP